MDTKTQILQKLQQNNGQTVSGGQLAQQLGISRTAVWKAVNTLRQDGYAVESIPGGGYVLNGTQDILSAYEIKKRLPQASKFQNVLVFEQLDSTNTYAKKLATEGLEMYSVILANKQTGGRGRLGRSFYSPSGQGIYLSLLIYPDIDIAKINFITLAAAVAVCRAIVAVTGLQPAIKWPNDLFLNGKKICGILTECSIEGESGRIGFLVCGIGINIFQKTEDFPPELKSIASSLAQGLTQATYTRADIAAAVITEFEKLYAEGRCIQNKKAILEEYKQHLFILGDQVQVMAPQGNYSATVLDIDEDGKLVLQLPQGKVCTLDCGEVSIRADKK